MLFNFFRSHSHESGRIKLQGIFEYLDNDTGNQLVMAKEFSIGDFGAGPGTKRAAAGKNRLSAEFRQFLGINYRTIDLHQAKLSLKTATQEQ